MAGDGNVRRYSDGTWQTFQSYLYAGANWSTWLDFGAAGIASGVTISSATLSSFCESSISTNASFAIVAYLIKESGSAFPADGTDAASRTLSTGVSRTFNPNTGGSVYQSWDVTADMQSLVNLPGWGTSSRAMATIQSVSANTYASRSGYVFGSGNAAKLDIVYTVSSTVFSYGFWSSFGRPLQHREGI